MLVNPESFIDRRNPDPQLYAWYESMRDDPRLTLLPWEGWWLPGISCSLNCYLPLPKFSVSGYQYDPAQQPYLLELWIEKSTMNAVLAPICQRSHINLVTSIGFQSVSAAIALLRRAERHGKPARVFYISDFDPGGAYMPDAVSRQLEYWRYRLGIDAEVKLQPLALTREQVIEYRLPSIPLKESDRRAVGFEARNGGMLATELDCLEALHPGVLAWLVEEAVAPYRDDELRDRRTAARKEAEHIAGQATQWVAQQSRAELAAIQAEVTSVLNGYRDRVEVLDDELQRELKPYRERMQAVRHAIQGAIDRVDAMFELPEPPEPDLEDLDEGGWLLDTDRDYLEQLRHYKARRDSTTEGQG